MAVSRRIYIFIYDGFELLDLSGPVSVFSAADRLSNELIYSTFAVSISGGLVRSGSGIEVDSSGISKVQFRTTDTILVVGAEQEPLQAALIDGETSRQLLSATQSVGRTASVCTGAFLLAQLGVLNERAATTHWRARKTLEQEYPSINTQTDTLYVADGNVWTSAGVSSGIDMALALVRADHGHELMRAVAKNLVVFSHRPGNQSQFSDVLAAQTPGESDFSGLISWLSTQVARRVSVSEMASKAKMTERTFHRKFSSVLGVSPARFLEDLRLDHAKHLLEDGQSVKQVSYAIGFDSVSGFRTAFKTKYGVSPSMHRELQASSL